MHKVLLKAKMLLCILTMSLVIFILAFSALLFPRYNKVKDVEFLTDDYYIATFRENSVSIGKFCENFDSELFEHIIVNYQWAKIKAIPFSEEELKQLGIDSEVLQDRKKQEDIAVINEKYLKICYEENNTYYIENQGVTYEVIGTFSDDKDDDLNETSCYLNLNANGLKSNNRYDCLFLDISKNYDAEQIVKSIKKKYPEIYIKKWSGTQYNTFSNNAYLFVVTLACAILLCMNCVAFTEAWLSSQKGELGIRRLVGATIKNNNCYIMKSYIGIFGISCGCAVLISFSVFGFLKRIELLRATRELFGTSLHMGPLLLAVIVVFVIGGITIELQYLTMMKKEILEMMR